MKTKLLIPLIAAATLSAAAFIFFQLTGHTDAPADEPRLLKLRFPGAAKLLKPFKNKDFKYEADSFSLELNPPDIYITRDKATTTLRGLALVPQNNDGATSRHSLYPRLTGKFTMQFFFFFEGPGAKKSSLTIKHRRGADVRLSREVHTVDSIERCRVSLDLKTDDRIDFIIQGNGCAVVGHPVFYEEARERGKTNYVFLICADTLRYDHVGAYNPAKTCTPNIDAFARDGILFQRAFSTSSWTLPAHMSLFTALPPLTHNVNYGNQVLSNKFQSLNEILSKKFICYSLNGDAFVSARYGFSRGFDFYREHNNEHHSRLAAKSMFKLARRFVEAERHRNAFFFLHTYQVHDPYLPEINLAKRFYQGEKNLMELNIVQFIRDRKALAMKLSAPRRQKIVNVYDAGVFTFDYRFGQFIDYLKMKGLYEDATIILFSDHGDEFMDHGCWVHTHTLYNELIQIPLIVKLPGSEKAGMQVSAAVSIMDILPTLLERFDLEYDRDAVEGKPLPGVTGEGENTGPRVFTAFLAPYLMNIPGKLAVISGDYKLIYSEPLTKKNRAFFTHPPQFEMFEMYNIINDPFEKENLFKTERKKAAELMKILKKYKFKRGKQGYLPALKKQLETLGYF
jgi:arylsulfatase A-like enzyme